MKIHDLMRKYGIQTIELSDGIGRAISLNHGVEEYPALIVTLKGPEENKGVYTLTECAIDYKLLDLGEDDTLVQEINLFGQAFKRGYDEQKRKNE